MTTTRRHLIQAGAVLCLTAAAAAAEILEGFAGEPVGSLLERCHERLRGTRGAAITLIVVDADAASCPCPRPSMTPINVRRADVRTTQQSPDSLSPGSA